MITTHDLCGHWGYPMFFRQVPLNKECYYFAERAYGLAVNNHRHHDLYIQGGNGGIKVRNSNAEGGIYLSGLIEGMRKFSVDVAGITMYFIVDGLWCEALCSDVYLTSVAGASIRGLYTSGSMVLRGCLSPKIVGGYLKDIDVDESCSDVKISGTRVTSMSKFKPATAEPFGVINASDVYKGASGQFVRPGWNFPDSLCDHTLQSWENGLPKGFTAPLTKVSKADITFQGRQAAKIEIDRLMSYTGLRYQLKKRDFAGRRSALTISAWVYKPSQGGMNPRIYLIYGGQGSTGEAFSIEPDKWTPITVTIYPKPDLTVDPAVLWGTYATSASQTGIFYIAMPTIGM